MNEAEHDVLGYMAFYESLRTKLRSTNPLKLISEEIKKRTNMAVIFPNREAVIQLIGASCSKRVISRLFPALKCSWKRWLPWATMILKRR